VYNYAVSVPWRKVRQNEEVLLAWEMNGKPLPKIHGYPLRVVVTGYIGARSCKWLYRINALEEPSLGPVQRQEYLYYTSQVRDPYQPLIHTDPSHGVLCSFGG
jgi:sulfite oxidase